MILIDFNGVTISSLMYELSQDKSATIDESLLRHVILSQLLFYRRKFRSKYGELVICADDGLNYWRRKVFPYYKAGRKKKRAASEHDWKQIHRCIDAVKEELQTIFPYKMLTVTGAEADDIIGALCKAQISKEPVLIISSDKDFLQLQRYPNVHQFSPHQKGFVLEKDPEYFLRYHIMKGDDGDGIPNFLSPDSVFVTEGVRQKSCYEKDIEVWIKQQPEEFCDEEMLKNYRRNELLIDLSKMPSDLEANIIEAFNTCKTGHRSKLLNYIIKKRLGNFLENIGDF